MVDLPQLASQYAQSVKAFLAVEKEGKRPSVKIAKEVEQATVEYAVTPNGHYAVEKDIAACEGRYPLLRKILLRAANQAALTRNVATLPPDTYSDRLNVAARLQERAARLRRKAARTKTEEDKKLAGKAHEQWRKAEASAQRLTVGDRFIVTTSKNMPIGTVGSLIRMWQAEYGTRVLLRQATGHEFWINFDQIERETS
jgi:hypothetical protein